MYAIGIYQKYIPYFEEKKVSNGALNYTVIHIFGLSRVKYVTLEPQIRFNPKFELDLHCMYFRNSSWCP